jgi:hypothetical protein
MRNPTSNLIHMTRRENLLRNPISNLINWNTPIKVPIKAAIDGVIDGTRSVTVELTVKVENIAIITNVKTVQVITYPLYHCKICIN